MMRLPGRNIVRGAESYLAVLVILVTVLSIGCRPHDLQTAQGEARSGKVLIPQNNLPPEIPETARALHRFESLVSTMTLTEVVAQCGLPDDDIGSGIHLFVYELSDGSTVLVGTADMKSLNHLIHKQADGAESYLLRPSNR